jgi:hypothetical protein
MDKLKRTRKLSNKPNLANQQNPKMTNDERKRQATQINLGKNNKNHRKQ